MITNVNALIPNHIPIISRPSIVPSMSKIDHLQPNINLAQMMNGSGIIDQIISNANSQDISGKTSNQFWFADTRSGLNNPLLKVFFKNEHIVDIFV